jgi:hypothetical protein
MNPLSGSFVNVDRLVLRAKTVFPWYMYRRLLQAPGRQGGKKDSTDYRRERAMSLWERLHREAECFKQKTYLPSSFPYLYFLSVQLVQPGFDVCPLDAVSCLIWWSPPLLPHLGRLCLLLSSAALATSFLHSRSPRLAFLPPPSLCRRLSEE